MKKETMPFFIGFAPYENPRYALSIVIEHGGTGSSAAAPLAKKIIKKVIDRHQLRKIYQLDLFQAFNYGTKLFSSGQFKI